MSKKQFVLCMALMQEYFGYSLKDEVLNLYWDNLGYMSDEDFERVTKKIITSYRPTNQNPFPRICEFSEMSGSSIGEQAQKALQRINAAIKSAGAYESVDLGHRAIHGVIRRFGGWVAVCGWTKEDWNINEGRMLEALESALRQNLDGPDFLQGIFQQTNGTASYVLSFYHNTRGQLIKKQNEPAAIDNGRKNYLCDLTEKFDMNKQLNLPGRTGG